MAHHIKIKPVPHKNKSGTFSTVKKDYEVWDRWRKNKELVGTFTTKAGAEQAVVSRRNWWQRQHLENHPNDLRYKNKFRTPESAPV